MTLPIVTVGKRLLTGAPTGGRGIKITAITSGNANLIHTATSGTIVGCVDEIWLYAVNNDPTLARKVYVQYGGSETSDLICVTLDPQGAPPVCLNPGFSPLQNASVVSAYGEVANVITIFGQVNHIVET